MAQEVKGQIRDEIMGERKNKEERQRKKKKKVG